MYKKILKYTHILYHSYVCIYTVENIVRIV
jgi:hypothetical protein